MTGAVAFVYGCTVYWRSGLVAPDPFVLAGVCVVSAAGVQVARDVWRRIVRRR